MSNILVIYLIIINIVGFLSMGIDKYKAIKDEWRIPEKTLFIIAILGGALGSWLGMYSFRHKTKHWYFVVGMPLILIVWIFILTRFNNELSDYLRYMFY